MSDCCYGSGCCDECCPGRECRCGGDVGAACRALAEALLGVANGIAAGLAVRFRDKWAQHESGCWLWFGSRDQDGYGIMVVGSPSRKQRAHRISWFLEHGELPSALVCHRCDVPSCVNPDHLFLGTNADNTKDRNQKGRQAFGTRARSAKLNPEKVREIRRLSSEGRSGASLAREFGVSDSAIEFVLKGRTWKQVTP